MVRTVGIVLFDEVEVLDFAGPFEVFSVASRISGRVSGIARPFEVVTVAASAAPVKARHGLQVLPSHSFADAPPIEVLIVPGGVVTAALDSAETIAWIRDRAKNAELTASVCTGAFLLARAGLLSGLTATTHWEDIAEMRAMFPEVAVVEDVRYVDHGRVATSAGISAGIGMSLHLVGRLAGPDLARATARQMQYDWAP